MEPVEYHVGDIITMKKPHPCGGYDFELLRVGADFRIKCMKCGHMMMVPRSKIVPHIKTVK